MIALVVLRNSLPSMMGVSSSSFLMSRTMKSVLLCPPGIESTGLPFAAACRSSITVRYQINIYILPLTLC
jgi:hypothetical protein